MGAFNSRREMALMALDAGENETADAGIKDAYERMVRNYPSSSYTSSAQSWLYNYEESKKEKPAPKNATEVINAYRESRNQGGLK